MKIKKLVDCAGAERLGLALNAEKDLRRIPKCLK